MKKPMYVLMILFTFSAYVLAQKKIKASDEWSEKDARKILDDSPWGQTQIETDTSEMFYSPTTRSASDSSRAAQGATNQATHVNFHIRFLSAKPIRQAIARSMELQQKSPNPQLSEQLRSFVDRKFDDWIVVAVTYDSRDQRFLGPIMQAFNSANTGLLKNNTYLELKGGKRLFLEEYKAPTNDGLGAKFLFPRVVEGRPFIRPDSGEVRFYAEFSKNLKLNMRFKVIDFTYEGELEY